jgi:hypothetical protein
LSGAQRQLVASRASSYYSEHHLFLHVNPCCMVSTERSTSSYMYRIVSNHYFSVWSMQRLFMIRGLRLCLVSAKGRYRAFFVFLFWVCLPGTKSVQVRDRITCVTIGSSVCTRKLPLRNILVDLPDLQPTPALQRGSTDAIITPMACRMTAPSSTHFNHACPVLTSRRRRPVTW